MDSDADRIDSTDAAGDTSAGRAFARWLGLGTPIGTNRAGRRLAGARSAGSREGTAGMVEAAGGRSAPAPGSIGGGLPTAEDADEQESVSEDGGSTLGSGWSTPCTASGFGAIEMGSGSSSMTHTTSVSSRTQVRRREVQHRF